MSDAYVSSRINFVANTTDKGELSWWSNSSDPECLLYVFRKRLSEILKVDDLQGVENGKIPSKKSESGSILHTARCEVLTLPYMECIELQPIHSYVVERLHL